jgi:hypothetical protein
MDNDKPTIVNQGLKFGLILGFANIAIYLLIYIIDRQLLVSGWIGAFVLLVNVVLMIWPVKNYKNIQGGVITFRDAFLVCFITLAGASLLSSVFNFVLYNIIDPTLPEFIKEKTIETTVSLMEKFNAPQEELDKAVEKLQAEDFSQNPGRIGKQYFGAVLFQTIPALIIAAVMRTKTKPVDDIQ